MCKIDNDEMRPTLYGSFVNSHRICAFCRKHKLGLTVAQMKQKECLRKQCNALKRYQEHPYWGLRAAKKQARLARKNRH